MRRPKGPPHRTVYPHINRPPQHRVVFSFVPRLHSVLRSPKLSFSPTHLHPLVFGTATLASVLDSLPGLPNAQVVWRLDFPAMQRLAFRTWVIFVHCPLLEVTWNSEFPMTRNSNPPPQNTKDLIEIFCEHSWIFHPFPHLCKYLSSSYRERNTLIWNFSMTSYNNSDLVGHLMVAL